MDFGSHAKCLRFMGGVYKIYTLLILPSLPTFINLNRMSSNIVNFLDHEETTKIHLQNALKTFFNKNTLVLNDTRLSIKPDILPHIPFVGSYDQRILSILSNTTVVFSHPFYTESHQYFSSL